MAYFTLLWFKLSLVLLLFLAIYGIVVYLMRNKIKKRLHDLTDEQKSKLAQSISKSMKIYKILFWMLPIYYIITFFVYSLNVQIFYFLLTGITLMYIAMIEGFLISKTYFKAFDN